MMLPWHSVWNLWALSGGLGQGENTPGVCPSLLLPNGAHPLRLRQRSVKPSTSAKVNSWRAGSHNRPLFISVLSDCQGKKAKVLA